MVKSLKAYWPILFLFIFTLFVAYKNIIPGTYLTGWDNLHPEFDFKTNIIDRSLFSVWQEYQGLGILAGNAHAADLIRQVGLWLLSLILPLWSLRYGYHFIAFFFGGLGAYFLGYYLTKPTLKHQFQRQIVSIIISLFYLLNLGTLQNFYTAYEAFSHFFAALPWLILVLFYYLALPTRKRLFVLSIVNFLAVPMSYIPTVFIVYLLILLIVLAFHIFHHYHKPHLKPLILTAVIVFVVNAFWLLPFTYFVINGTQAVQDATINRIFSEEAFLRNQKHGAVGEVALFRGFWFSTTDLVDNEGNHDYLMRPWIDHFKSPLVPILAYVLFGLSILGVVAALVQRKKHTYALTATYLIGLFFLINTNPPTGFIFEFLQQHLPFFKQVFRFPYTKFIVPTVLMYSVFIGLGLESLFHITKKFKFLLLKLVPWMATLLLAGFTIYVNLPTFQGSFFYSFLRQNIPSEYFAVFKYFQSQSDAGRIAYLPSPTFWGWSTYDWGYRGSGFPWYGIPQPITDRAFDVWSSSNENFYQEISHAIYDQDSSIVFESVLNKYNIDYIWLDEHIISLHKPLLTDMSEVIKWLEQNPEFQKVLSLDKQTIYKRNLSVQVVQAVTPFVENITQFSPYDPLFLSNNIYNNWSSSSIFYPFSDLDSYVKNWYITKTVTGIYINTQVPAGNLIQDAAIQIEAKPTLMDGNLIFTFIKPQIFYNQKQLDFSSQSFSLPLNLNSQVVLQINDELFPVSALPEKVKFKSQSNLLQIYATYANQYQDISEQLFKERFQNCSIIRAHSQEKYSGRSDIDNLDILTLTGSYTRPCIFNKLAFMSDLFQDNSTGIIDVQFEFLGRNQEQLDLCLTEEGKESCFFRGSQKYQQNLQWQAVRYLVNPNMPLDNIWLKLELNADNAVDQQVSMRNLKVNVYKQPLQTAQFNAEFSQNQTDKIFFSAPSQLSVRLDSEEKISIKPASIDSPAVNCDKFGSDTYERKILSDEIIGNYVRYESFNASSCETFILPQLSDQDGVLIEMVTRNVSGRPIKICLRHDPPGNCLLEDVISAEPNEWQNVYYIVPPVNSNKQQFFFEIDNYALGREERVNDILEINFYPIPYEYLKQLYVRNEQYVGPDNGKIISTTKTKHSNPSEYWSYLNNVNLNTGENRQNSTLILYQAFHPGWVAYKIDDNQTGFKKYLTQMFPYIFGERLTDHVLVNNWANGWILKSSDSLTTDDQRLMTIYLFFWPQVLEIIGFVLLPLPFIWILRKSSGQPANAMHYALLAGRNSSNSSALPFFLLKRKNPHH